MSRPQPFGAYDLIERVNVGGMAEVFRAVHRDSGRVLAIKRILPSVAEDDEFISMFHDEAQIASQLDHPNIAKIFDIGRVDSSYFIALEFVDGRDMRTIFDNAGRRRIRLPLSLVFHVILSLCKGLEYAHNRTDAQGRPLGLVHRDVSPPNILVSFEGEIKLIDFGIAKAAGKLARTQVGSIKGKFGYMSPEQVRGLPVDRRSDLFSVGICLWEFLTGQRLFHGDNEIVVMERIRNADVPPLRQLVPTLDPALERIVLRALAKDVDERYSSASDFHADLSAYAHTAGMLVQREQAAAYMRQTFIEDATHRVASPEEAHAMAENKGGSDLDVFEGLARKPQARPVTSPPAPPSSTIPPSGVRGGTPPPPPTRARTLVGMAPVPPPPGPRPSLPSLPGMPPMPSSRPLPPPGMPLPGLVPPPPSGARATSVLPTVSAPPGALGSVPPPSMPVPMAPPPPTATPVQPPPAEPAPVQAQPQGAAPASVEMDWDDEDEKTQVYDKQSPDDLGPAAGPSPAAGTPPPAASTAAAALLARSGSVAPPMARPPSIPPASQLPRIQPPAAPPAENWAPTSQPAPGFPPPTAATQAEPTTVLPARKGSGGLIAGILAAVVALGAVAAGGYYYFTLPTTGTLKVYVSGPGGSDVKAVKVFVDGTEACQASPCTQANLPPGIHDVKVTADGYQPIAPRGVEIKAGGQSKIELELRPASAGTGLKVASTQQGVKLFIDEKEVGPLPQTLTDLAPGSHKLRFVGSDRYKPEERSIDVTPDRIQDLGEVNLPVLKGKATLELATPGARVLLIPASGEKREINEGLFKNGQLSLDIDTSKDYHIEATKAGYDDLKIPVEFPNGQAEKTFRIELTEKGKTPPPTAAATTPKPPKGNEPATPPTTPEPTATEGTTTTQPANATGPAKLNINSIPPSAVLIDGRPVGRTPKSGVEVSPGTHTITFVHPDMGRKSASVTVGAGQSKAVSVRF